MCGIVLLGAGMLALTVDLRSGVRGLPDAIEDRIRAEIEEAFKGRAMKATTIWYESADGNCESETVSTTQAPGESREDFCARHAALVLASKKAITDAGGVLKDPPK